MKNIDAVRNRFGSTCIHHSCKKSGCRKTIRRKAKDPSFILRKAPAPYFLVDFDESCDEDCGKVCFMVGSNDRRCDWLFIADDEKNRTVWVAPIEVTSGKKESRARKQLQAGARFAERIFANNGWGNPSFCPVLVGKLRPDKAMNLRKSKGSRKSVSAIKF